MIRVVGLDLSLTSTGIAIVDLESVPVWDVRTIESKGKETASLDERRRRLSALREQITTCARAATLVVIEQPAYSRTVGSMHDRSGLWWLVVDELASWGIPVAEVGPTKRAKYAAGSGTAGKDTVLLAASRRYPDVPMTGNDTADATLLAAMGARHLGHPVEKSLPAGHLAAMKDIRWPELRMVDVPVGGLL
jgi:crossover junction endodeoxyribonuclease RuvC